MSLSTAATAEVIGHMQQQLKLNRQDCGSVEIQVALFSKKIDELSKHFESHKKDEHSRMGLKKLVNKRRRLLKYLKSIDPQRYATLIKLLGLRH